MEKLREEEKQPATEQKRLYTDLGKRDKHVVSHESALPLAMTDEHVRKCRYKPVDLHHFYELQQKPCVFRLPLFLLQQTTNLRLTFDAAERNGRFGSS